MDKPIKNLFTQTEAILLEGLVDNAAKLAGIEKDVAQDIIKELNFTDYLELGNAIDIEDAETVKKILNVTKVAEPNEEFDLEEDHPDPNDEHQNTLLCNLCGSQGYDRHGNTCTKCGGQGRVTLDGEMITGEEFDLEEDHNERRFYVSNFPNVRGRYKITAISKDKAGVYDISMGENGVWYDPKNTNNRLKFTDNQAKPMTADWIYYIMNIKSLEEADESSELGKPGSIASDKPGAKIVDGPVTPPSATKPLGAKSPPTIPKIPEVPKIPGEEQNQDLDMEYKEVNDLQIGDEIEVSDIGGEPIMVKIMSTNGPNSTILVRGEEQTDHMIKKDSILTTPSIQETRRTRLKRNNLMKETHTKMNKDVYEDMHGMPNLDRYWVYIDRDDVDYVMYHIPRSQAKEGEPRFLKVDKATGDWQTQQWKANNEPAVQQGKGSGPHAVEESIDKYKININAMRENLEKALNEFTVIGENSQESPIKILRRILQDNDIGAGRGYNDKNVGNRKIRVYTSGGFNKTKGPVTDKDLDRIEVIVQAGMEQAGYEVRKVIASAGSVKNPVFRHQATNVRLPRVGFEAKAYPNVTVWLEGNPVGSRYQTELDEDERRKAKNVWQASTDSLISEDFGHFPQGGGVDPHKFRYDVVLQGASAYKIATNVPFAKALNVAKQQLQSFHDMSIQGGGDPDSIHVEKTYYRPKIGGKIVELPEWLVKDNETNEITYIIIKLAKKLDEVAPPGMEGWIKKRKPEFKKRYGDRWEEVLYATAWKQKNNESIEEDRPRISNPAKPTRVHIIVANAAIKVSQWIKKEHAYLDPNDATDAISLKTAQEDIQTFNKISKLIKAGKLNAAANIFDNLDSIIEEELQYVLSDRTLRIIDKFIKAQGGDGFYRINISNEGIKENMADNHQKKIAIDTVKNPAKGIFLGGPTAEEAEKTLRDKFGYSDKQIAKLKENTKINEALHFFVDPISNGMFEVRNNHGDLHDTYDDGKEARQVAADLNAQHNEIDEGINESWYGNETGRELKIGSSVTAANGQSGEVLKFIDLYHHGRSAKVRFYDSPDQYFYVAVDSNNKIQGREIDEEFKNTIVDKPGDRVMTPMGAGTVIEIGLDTEETVQRVLVKLDVGDFDGDTFKFDIFSLSRLNEDKDLTRMKELAGISENYGDFSRARRRALKSGVFKSKAIGNTVKIMGPVDFGNDEHRGEIGVITNARREPTFSQMHPFIIMYSVKLESGEKIYIRRENIRKIKSVQETDQKTIKTKRGPCDHCRGTGKDNAIGDPCIMCAGSGMRNYENMKETASGGATAAGAIASSPTALGGMVSRNTSIYGQTKLKKKPTPKKRPTREEAGDGVGRSKKN